MESKVKIKNLISSRVVLMAPEINLKRVWEKKGVVRTIPFEQLQEAYYNPGVEALFLDGVLGIDDMEVKVALGLEDESSKEPERVITLDDKQRERYLTVLPIHEFKQKVKELPQEQIRELANYAIEHELVDINKVDILNKLADIDVMSAIKLNRDNNETKEK